MGKILLVSFEGAEEDLVNSVISVLDSGREKFLFQEIQFQSKIWHKIDKFVSTLSERISSGGVSQLEVQAEGERDIFGNMPALARKAAAEGIVLLKNNNALPYNCALSRLFFSVSNSTVFFIPKLNCSLTIS